MIALEVAGLRYAVGRRGSGDSLLLVHGFTGRGTSWAPQLRSFARRYATLAPDLPGHGRSGIPADPGRGAVERIADDLAAVLVRLGASPANVIGYSFGARVALRLAVAHPGAVRRLVLESPSAGIADPAERAARRVGDAALADRIERDGIAAFVAEWERLPIFASHAALPPGRAAALRAERLRNRPAGLAASLRGAGQGRMEPLHDRLGAIAAPTLVIAGGLDPVGLARAEAVARGIPAARMVVLPDAGHTPHLEAPSVFRTLVLDFLQEEPAA